MNRLELKCCATNHNKLNEWSFAFKSTLDMFAVLRYEKWSISAKAISLHSNRSVY